jgi:hypothetical protein
VFPKSGEKAVKLSELASIAEIVGAVAVVASLAYVALQIDQNTDAIEASTRIGRLDFGRQQSQLLITEPGLAKLVLAAEKNADNLTEEEQLIFYEFTSWWLATWEMAYMDHIDGLVEEETGLGWDGYYRLFVIENPGYKKFFQDTRPQWDSRFLAHVDNILGAPK